MIDVDVDHQISAVERTIGDRVLEAGTARVLTARRIYDATVEELWDACTSAERIPRWFLPISGDLRAGGRYQLEGNAGGTIERCDPPRSFAATWEYGGEVTWIEVGLDPAGDGRARLTLEHIAHVDDERWLQYGPGAVGVGWDGALMGLGLHLATGEANDPAQSAAWMGSPDGIEFFTRSSRGWADASIAAGTDASEARAAEERTTAAYTGTGG
jgi:uncharacterized protein YndB with AHSA1/START domain